MKQGLFNLKHVTSPWSGKWEVAWATRFLLQGSALKERHLVSLLSFCFPTCNPRSSSISLWQEFSALGRQVTVYQKQLDWARFACGPRHQLCLAVPQLWWLLLVLTGSSGRAWVERTSVSQQLSGWLPPWGAVSSHPLLSMWNKDLAGLNGFSICRSDCTSGFPCACRTGPEKCLFR